MKHDHELRAAAERMFYNHSLEPGSDFAKAEQRRDPEYLAAIDAALEMRRAIWEFEATTRQLPLL